MVGVVWLSFEFDILARIRGITIGGILPAKLAFCNLLLTARQDTGMMAGIGLG